MKETMSMAMLKKAIAVMEAQPYADKQMHDMVAGENYYNHLQSLPPMPKPEPGMLGGYLGINIFFDKHLPPDIMVVRNRAGEILAVFKLPAAKKD